MQSKLPAFQFYPGDWRKDPGVQSLDFHHRGVWFELLCMMHESEDRGVLTLNLKPTPIPALARQLGLSEDDCSAVIDTLVDYGVANKRDDGAIFNRRMVKDEAKRRAKVDSGRAGGLAKAKRTPSEPPSETLANGLAKARSSSSTSTSSSTSVNKSGDKSPEFDWNSEKDCPSSLNTDEVRSAYAVWLAYRKERRLPVWKPMTLRTKLRAFEGMSPKSFVDAVNHSIGNGYQGLILDKASAPKVRPNDQNTCGDEDILAKMKRNTITTHSGGQ